MRQRFLGFLVLCYGCHSFAQSPALSPQIKATEVAPPPPIIPEKKNTAQKSPPPSLEHYSAYQDKAHKVYQLLQQKRWDEAYPIALDVYKHTQTTDEKLRYVDWITEILVHKNRYNEAIATLTNLRHHLDDAKDHAVIQEKCQKILDQHTDYSALRILQYWTEKYPEYKFLYWPVTLQHAKQECAHHQEPWCHDLHQKLEKMSISTTRDNTFKSEAFLAQPKPSNPRIIGVVLPLSGKFGVFGERTLTAIRLAIPEEFKLVIKDTQADPNQAAAAIDSLIEEHQAIATIGPLLSTEAYAAAEKANTLGMLLMTLSHREQLTDFGPYIFRTGLTVKAQAEALAKLAFEQLHFRKFALLYPESHYGSEFIHNFWDAVDRYHGEIRGSESYNPNATTFRQPIRQLVGRWFLTARTDFKEKAEALLQKKMSPWRYNQAVKQIQKTLPPIVDFDAIVIPDSSTQIGLIAPALAFEDIILTHNKRLLAKLEKSTKRKLDPITLLGGSTWNAQKTTENCDHYCEDAVFVDAFFAESKNPEVVEFVDRFREATVGNTPGLPEAIAFDTASILVHILKKKNPPQTRELLAQELFTIEDYNGVTGKLHFATNGEVMRTLQALTIKNQQINALKP